MLIILNEKRVGIILKVTYIQLNKLRQIVLMCCMLICAFIVAGCDDEAMTDDTVRFALEAEPATLDPAKSTALMESDVELVLFEGLTRLDDKEVPQPAAAESWNVSPDGTEYTFHLRDGLVWNDGTPLTAHDFEFAWKRVLNPETASENAYMMYPLKNGEEYFKQEVSADEVGVKALDDKTLYVKLKAPITYFLNLTAFHAYYPVPQHVVEKDPEIWAANDKIVSNGPFKLTHWIHSNQLQFTKSDTYWDKDNVKLETMQWPISESQSTRVSMVESGQANITIEPPISEQERLKQEGLYKVSPNLGAYYYSFNTAKAPFDNPLVRKAFSMAVDREMLVNNVVKGDKKPAYAWVPPGLKNPVTGKDFREEGGDFVEYNPEKARELLAQAGYPNGEGLPPITILYNTNEMHKAVAEVIQSMWKNNLNVNAELLNQESKVYLEARNQGNFQVARASWIGDYADPMTFMDVYLDSNNDGQYHNPAYNDLILRAQSTNDQAVRMQSMHEAEKILMNDNVLLPIYYTTQPYIAQPYVKGYHWSLLGTIDFKEAYIENPTENK